MMSTGSVIQQLVARPGGHEPQPSAPFAGSPRPRRRSWSRRAWS